MLDEVALWYNESMFLDVVFAFLAACGVSLIFNTSEYGIFLSNNAVAALVFLIYLWSYRELKSVTKRQFYGGLTFCVIASCCIVLGAELEINSGIDWHVLTVVKIFCLVFSFYPLVEKAMLWIDTYSKKKGKTREKSVQKKQPVKKWWYRYLNKHRCLDKCFQFAVRHKMLALFLCIFFFGFLVFLAVYPGVYGYDINAQLASIFSEEAVIKSHFSVPFVLLLGGMVKLGYAFFGSFSAGYALFVLLQLMFISFVAARLSCLVLDEFKNKKLFRVTVFLFCTFPLYTIMAVSAVQDVYFSGFVVLLFIELYLISKNPRRYWNKKTNYLIFIGLVFGVCFARNNGLYVLVVALPLILCAMRKGKRLLTFAMIVLPAIVYLAVKGPIFELFNIEKGDTIKEMSSVPSQQLARVFVKHKDELNEEQIRTFETYYNTDSFKEYYDENPSIADLMKAGINTASVRESPMGYLGLWIENGLKYALDYLDAFAMNSYAFWYPGKIYPDTRMYHPLIEYENLEVDEKIAYLGIKRDSKFPLYDKLLGAIVGRSSQINQRKAVWEYIPVISIIFTPGFYFIVVLACISLTCVYKKWRYFVPLSVVVGVYCTLLLSPVGLWRYCFPVVMLSPFLIGMCMDSSKS